MSGIVNALRYESGSFTPVLDFGGGSTGITYATRFGNYTIIDGVLSFHIYIQLTNKGSDVGNANITGLPYAAVNPFEPGVVGLCDINLTGIDYVVSAVSGTNLQLRSIISNSVAGILTDAEFSNTAIVCTNGSYKI